MIKLLDSTFCSTLQRVTSNKLFVGQNPDINGLFSSQIFGSTPEELNTKFASIALNGRFMHPIMFELFTKIYKKETSIAVKHIPYLIKDGSIVPQLEATEDSFYGFNPIFENIDVLQRKENKTASSFWNIYEKYSKNIFIECIPVIPLGFRSYKNEIEFDMINNTYLSIINAVSQLSKYERNLHDKKYNRSYDYVQNAINNLLTEIEAKLSKKTGIVRGNILGKRVDFSARGVITPDPQLDPDTLGVPIMMLTKIYEPWILRLLTMDYHYTVTDALDLIQKTSKGYELPEKDKKNIREAIDKAIQGKYVLTKRDPSIHRLSWQSFKVKPVEDKTIHLYPLVVTGFNADFDGDTMSIFTPMSEEAIGETSKMMNPYSVANPREIKYSFTKEYQYVICLLLARSYGPFAKSKTVLKYETTKGREIIFNCLDDKFRTLTNLKKIDQSNDIESIISYVTINFGIDTTKEFIDNLQKTCLDIMTVHTGTVSLDDFALSEKTKELVTEFINETDMEKKSEIQKQIQDKIISELSHSESMQYIVKCKAVKYNQLTQLLGVKGLVVGPSGKTISINGNFANGLDKTDYFNAGEGARMGIVSRASKTAITGYLARKLAYGLASVELDSKLKDCGTHNYVRLASNKDIVNRIINRFVLKDNELVKITTANKNEFAEGILTLRSPIYCKSPKICTTCYGHDYKYLNSELIGFMAAQSISERLTQEILKVFHLGGTVSLKTPNLIEELSNNTQMTKTEINNLVSFDSDNYLIANKEMMIVLSKEYYNLSGTVIDQSNELFQDMLIGDFVVGDNKYKLAINEQVMLYIHSYNSDRENYYLKYEQGDKICLALPESSDIELKVKKILSIVEGRMASRDINHFLNLVYKNLKGFGVVNLVHMEILVSELYRCKENPTLPARLCTSGDYMQVSVKDVPFYESAIRGLEFENFSKGILNGLEHPERMQHSVLDDMMLSSEPEVT